MRLAALCLIGVAAWLAARRALVGDFVWSVWGDRDLARSAVSWASLPTTGAELSYGVGAGTPGGAFGYLLWAVQSVWPGPHAAWAVQVTLDGAAAALVGASVARRLGLWGGAIAFATWLSLAPNAMNQTQLWNPAWLSIFLAVASVAWARVVVVGDTRAMAVWAGALALGAQMHVTAGVLALAMLPGLWVARPTRLGRGALWAALAVLAAYAPYLIQELRLGFPNTRMLLVSEQIEDLTTPLVSGTRPAQTLWSAIVTLAGRPAVDALPHTLPRAAVLTVGALGPLLGGLALLWSARREVDPVRRRLLAAVALGVLVALGSLARSRAYEFESSNTSRYLMFTLPLVCWLAALAGDALLRAVAHSATLRAAAIAAVLASVGLRLAAFEELNRQVPYRPLSWSNVSRWTTHLAAQGLLEEAPSNTTVFSVSQKITREKAVPIESLRAVPDHEILPVAPTEACRFVAIADWPDPQLADRITAASLTEALAPDGPRVVDLHVDVAEPGLAIGVWIPDVGPCPANLTQRYLLTPDEQVTLDRGRSVAVDTAVRLPDDGDDARWLLAFDPSHGTMHPTPMVHALLRVARDGEDIQVALSSNQLRGIAWNGGFFVNARVRNVRLAVHDPLAGAHELRLAPGVAGRFGVSAPFFARGAASSVATFSLRVDLQPDMLEDDQPRTGAIVPLEIPLN